MKTLDLNAYGVSEMNKQEIMEVSGGWRQDFEGGPIGVFFSRHIFRRREEQVSEQFFCPVVDFPGVGLPPK